MNEREDDRKWRESVEARLVSLTSAQKITDDQLDEIAVDIEDLNETLNGTPKERDGGLIGQVNALETGLNSVRSVLQPDSLGHGGLINEFRTLKHIVSGKEKSLEYRWGLLNSATVTIGSIIVALITSAAFLVTNWDRVSAFLKHEEKPSQIDTLIHNAEHPKSRHRHLRIKAAAPPPEAKDGPSDEMPALLDNDGADRR